MIKCRVIFNAQRQEGLYPVYKPFFEEVKNMGCSWDDPFLEIPDDNVLGSVLKLAGKYSDYLRLIPICEAQNNDNYEVL
jgi:hypothetical protein